MRRPEYATPFADLFRELTPAERRELTESIRANGVMVAVNVYTSAKHGPSLLDGANRWAISGELGVPCPVNDLGTMSDKDARELAEQLNHCRRHLTPADWREMAAKRAERVKRVTEKRKEGKSLRTIAEEEGVDVSVIHKDLKKAADSGVDLSTGEVQNDEVTGKDGKTYKATKPAKQQPEPVIEPDHAPPAQTAQPDTDYAETEIGDDPPEVVVRERDPLLPHEPAKSPYGDRPPLPGADDFQTRHDPSAKEAVAQRKLFIAIRKSLREVIEGLDEVAMKPCAAFLLNLEYADHQPILKPVVYRHKNRQQTIKTFAPLFDLMNALVYATPKKVCDGCRGHGCGSCRHAGFLPHGELQKPSEAGIPFPLGGDPWDDTEE